MRGSAIVAALPAALRELAESAAFRVYVTDALYCMGDNKRLTVRFYDLLDKGYERRQRAMTPAEADALAARLGITFATEDE